MLSTGLVLAAVGTGIVVIVVAGCVVLVVLLATLSLRGQRRQRAQRHDETRPRPGTRSEQRGQSTSATSLVASQLPDEIALA